MLNKKDIDVADKSNEVSISTPNPADGVAEAPPTPGKSPIANVQLVTVTCRIPDQWHVIGNPGEPAFLNGWVNYDVNSYPSAAFRRMPHGPVELRGLIKTGVVGGGDAGAIFSLPAQYRNNRYKHIATVSFNGAAVVVSVVAVSNNNGNIVAHTGGNDWFSLDGVVFWPDDDRPDVTLGPWPLKLNWSGGGSVLGCILYKVEPLVTGQPNPPLAHCQVDWKLGNGCVLVNNVSGLISSKDYRLTFALIGE